MLNVVTLIGRLTRDPEIKYTPNGKAVCQFHIAVDRGTVNKDGKQEADFIGIVAWEKTAEAVTNYLKKGRLIAVQGRLQIRQYETQDGQRREIAEVVAKEVKFLERVNKETTAPKQGSQEFESDDDLPF